MPVIFVTGKREPFTLIMKPFMYNCNCKPKAGNISCGPYVEHKQVNNTVMFLTCLSLI